MFDQLLFVQTFFDQQKFDHQIFDKYLKTGVFLSRKSEARSTITGSSVSSSSSCLLDIVHKTEKHADPKENSDLMDVLHKSSKKTEGKASP